MSLFFSTTPNPSSQEEGTTGGGFSLLLGGDHRQRLFSHCFCHTPTMDGVQRSLTY